MKITKTDIQYGKNKSAKVGEILICPICHKEFGKKHYAQAFCCGKCKDAYWNTKKDRHRAGYYKKYDDARPERKLRRALYSMDIVTARDTDEMYARMALVNDEDFRRYVNDDYDANCCVDLSTMYNNYLCRDID